MSELRFACNPVGPEQITALLAAAEPSGWLVLDAALFDEPAFEVALRRLPAQRFNTLEDTPLAPFGKRAPWAFKLDGTSLDATAHSLAALYRSNHRAPALSTICTAAEERTLKRTFAYLATPRLDEMPVHCRFADTRILPHLLRNLTLHQQEPLAASINRWTWLGRSANCESWVPTRTVRQFTAAAPPRSLELNPAQYGAMLDAAEPDSMVLLLEESTPQLVPENAGAAFHDSLTQTLTAASGLHVSGTLDRLQFIVLALSLGKGFHCTPCLEPTWRAVSNGASLTDVVSRWEEDVWNILEARRTTAEEVR